MNTQEIYDVLDNAFSTFMVVDMNNMRCDTHSMCTDEAEYYAKSDGARTGHIVASACHDKDRLFDALYQLLAHMRHNIADGEAVDPVEEHKVREDRIFTYLCCKYQHDEHRRDIQEMFAAACMGAMADVLVEYKNRKEVRK